MRKLAGLMLIGISMLTSILSPRAEVNEIRITRQPSIVYLPLVIMDEAKLFEKHAAQGGLGNVKASWTTLTGGGASVDALLAGNVDLVTTGASNLLLAWERTKGEIRGVAAASAIPMVLVTRNPDVKTIADLTQRDRIAVPTLKVSMQASLLKLAAEKAFGPEGRDRLDPMMVQLGHPDAAIALINPSHEVNSHVSLQPYLDRELADPRIRKVLSSADVVSGPISNGVVFGSRKFHDANPRVMAAFLAALEEAIRLIKDDPRKAAEHYLANTKEKISLNDLIAMISAPDIVYSMTPHNSEIIADLFVRSGLIKNKPNSWKDYFFPAVHGLSGS